MLTECRRRRAPIWPRLLTLVGSHPHASHPGAPRTADPYEGLCRRTKWPCAHALLKDVDFWASVMHPRCRHACSTVLGNPSISPHPHSCMCAPPRPVQTRVSSTGPAWIRYRRTSAARRWRGCRPSGVNTQAAWTRRAKRSLSVCTPCTRRPSRWGVLSHGGDVRLGGDAASMVIFDMKQSPCTLNSQHCPPSLLLPPSGCCLDEDL